MITKPLPISSVDTLPALTWKEIDYGYARRWLGWRTVVSVAMKNVERGDDNPLGLELATVGKDETWKLSPLLKELALSERNESDEDLQRKWLFIVLKWLYDNQSLFADPLLEVEWVYAEFNYPEEIVDFVGFMPPMDGYDPSAYSLQENRDRLFLLWLRFLVTAEKRYG